jgi:cellulose synthase/poly-beta-1,6-N-acetylglucosamine synthase-like glycosyltransferase
MIVLNVLLTAWAVLLLLPCGVLLVQVLAALLPVQRAGPSTPVEPASTSGATPSVCLLMPAHNEALGIATVLQDLLPQLGPRMRLLVVADNCTDATVDVVRGHSIGLGNVEVIERHNTQLRGKGYALDHGVRHLENNPPQVVLVVDADCVLRPGTIETLTKTCLATGRPAQALYLMHSPPGAPIKTLVAEFAWLVKNQVRAAGFHRLRLPCPLMGTGMAFSWQHISTASLATGHIVEDLQLGIELTRAGHSPQFCPQALVTSYFPTAADGLQTQRARWEHGHLGVIIAEFPRLLKQAVITGNGALLAMALDLSVPPLALLTLVVGVLLMVTGILGLVTGVWLPLLVSCAPALSLAVAVLLAWFAFGRQIISLRQLCVVPIYVLAKVPLYVGFIIKRQSKWVRAKRDGE